MVALGRATCVASTQRPLNCGDRFARKAEVPSALSSVPAHKPHSAASSHRPSARFVSMPRFTASSENFTAIGALETNLADGLSLEASLFGLCAGTDDKAEG